MELPVLKCPRCGEGRMIVRSTTKKSERTKYYPEGKPLGEIRRYHYCEFCNFPMKSIQKIGSDTIYIRK